MKAFTLYIFLIISLVGCQNESVSTKAGVGSSINLTGTWLGTLKSASSAVGTVGINVSISQVAKIKVEDQQEGRQVISGVMTFGAPNCYNGGTVNSETSRIDGRNIRLEIDLNGAGPLVFQGVLSGNRMSGNFTAEVTCTIITPIVEEVETTTDDTGSSTVVTQTGGEESIETLIDQGPMTLRRS